ncbi:unnamed protein product, partial [marine sediment metagenome]
SIQINRQLSPALDRKEELRHLKIVPVLIFSI